MYVRGVAAREVGWRVPVVVLLADDELVVSPNQRARARASRAVAAVCLAAVVILRGTFSNTFALTLV